MVGLLDLVKIDQMLQNLKKINTETTALLTDCGHKIFGFTRVIRVLLIISNPLFSFYSSAYHLFSHPRRQTSTAMAASTMRNFMEWWPVLEGQQCSKSPWSNFMSIVIPRLLICYTQVLQGRLWVCWRRLGSGFHFLCFLVLLCIFVGINSAQGIELGKQGICYPKCCISCIWCTYAPTYRSELFFKAATWI